MQTSPNVSDRTLGDCNILGKAEFLNPGGYVKDRAAKGLSVTDENSRSAFLDEKLSIGAFVGYRTYTLTGLKYLAFTEELRSCYFGLFKADCGLTASC